MLLFTPAADAAISVLEADPTTARIVERLNAFLRLLDSNSGHPDCRRRRFVDPPGSCVVLQAGADEIVVLWDANDAGDPVVFHVGPASFA